MFLRFIRRVAGLLFLALIIFVHSACDPVPGHQLSSEQKATDMQWMFSIFEQNYAPLEYKQKLHDFDYAKLKASYLSRAKRTKSNQEFYDLVFEFVSQFQDAHTSAQLTASSLPGRVTVSYLGFSGIRKGSHFLILDLLPTIQKERGSQYPLSVGEIITHVNGMSVDDYTLAEVAKYRDLGNKESNITFHMNHAFNRISIQNGIPKDQDVTLTVKNPETGVTRDVRLPWIKKDLHEFRLEQTAHARANSSAEESDSGDEFKIQLGNNASSAFSLQFLDFTGRPLSFDLRNGVESKLSARIRRGQRFLDAFRFEGGIDRWTTRSHAHNSNEEPTGFAALRLERAIPEHAIDVTIVPEFPAYISAEDLMTRSGNASNRKSLIGYLRIPTFSPDADEETVISGIKETLARFQHYGVKNIVVDLLHNGGGSLSLVYRMAQAFSPQAIKNHTIRYGLNDQWLDSMQRGSLSEPSDTERELMRRLHEKLSHERSQGKRISSAYPVEEILPFQLEPNKELERNFNMVLLVDEMCASAADIFASLIKQNKMGVLVGGRTMGAGGNVVSLMADQSPSAHFKLQQTESLLINPDGTYIENVGVQPHVEMTVSASVDEGYMPVIEEAFEILRNPSEYKKLLKAKKPRRSHRGESGLELALDCEFELLK